MLRLAAAVGYVLGRVEHILERTSGVPLFLTVTEIVRAGEYDVTLYMPTMTALGLAHPAEVAAASQVSIDRRVDFVVTARDDNGQEFSGIYSAHQSSPVKSDFPVGKLSELEKAVRGSASQNSNPVYFLARVKDGLLPRDFPFVAYEALVG